MTEREKAALREARRRRLAAAHRLADDRGNFPGQSIPPEVENLTTPKNEEQDGNYLRNEKPNSQPPKQPAPRKPPPGFVESESENGDEFAALEADLDELLEDEGDPMGQEDEEIEEGIEDLDEEMPEDIGGALAWAQDRGGAAPDDASSVLDSRHQDNQPDFPGVSIPPEVEQQIEPEGDEGEYLEDSTPNSEPPDQPEISADFKAGHAVIDGKKVAVVPVAGFEGWDELEHAQFEFALTGANSSDPAWTVFADGRPLARIAFGDLNVAPEDAEHQLDFFVAPNYPEHLSEAMRFSGVIPTLRQLNASYYVDAMANSDIVANVRKQIAAKFSDEQKRRLAATRKSLMRRVGLVIRGMEKGAIRPHPLKQALFLHLRAAGIANPVSVIEAAFHTVGEEVGIEGNRETAEMRYFDQVLGHAEEWMGYNDDTLAEMENMYNDIEPMEPEDDDMGAEEEPPMPEDESPPADEAHFAATSDGGFPHVPVQTFPGSGHSNLRERMRSRLRLSRVTQMREAGVNVPPSGRR